MLIGSERLDFDADLTTVQDDPKSAGRKGRNMDRPLGVILAGGLARRMGAAINHCCPWGFLRVLDLQLRDWVRKWIKWFECKW